MEISKYSFKVTDDITIPLEYPSDAEVILTNVLHGEYDIKVYFDFRPIILDLGANMGFFSIWSLKRWNPSAIYCYEPLNSNFAYLEKNISNIPPCDVKIVLEKKAVEAPSRKLYFGKYNCGQATFIESSVFRTDEYEEVESTSAVLLPACQVLKVDTEGCEKEILTNYLNTHDLPMLVMFEYHSDLDRKFLDEYMYSKGFLLAGSISSSIGLGVLKYILNMSTIRKVSNNGYRSTE